MTARPAPRSAPAPDPPDAPPLRLRALERDVENDRAVRAYERTGFRVEGELREEFFAGGRYRNAFRMAIPRRDHPGVFGTS